MGPPGVPQHPKTIKTTRDKEASEFKELKFTLTVQICPPRDFGIFFQTPAPKHETTTMLSKQQKEMLQMLDCRSVVLGSDHVPMIRFTHIQVVLLNWWFAGLNPSSFD